MDRSETSGAGATEAWRTAELGGAILLVWTVFLSLEHLAVGFGYRRLFTGAWEMGVARNHLSPFLLSLLALPALLLAAFARWGARTRPERLRAALLAVGALYGSLVGFGVTRGRHFESLPLRVGFVVAVAAISAFALSALPRRVVAMSSRSPIGTALGLAIFASLLWLADARVLPRLYPAFHDGLFVLVLFAGAAIALVLRGASRRTATRSLAIFPLAAPLLLMLGPRAERAISFATNARFVLTDHAPFLGRSIAVLDRLFAVDDEVSTVTTTATLPTAVARELQWNEESVLLVTVDALRADHVGTYGYKRPTTPFIDALAKEGTVFERAYCPTPHTSYSVTSMMTGKYMRPLMNHGLGTDSELLANALRRYGFKTAGFYPPAVFFIDGERFRTFEEAKLGFEYARIEFAAPDLRRNQVERYLRGAGQETRVFLWVHLFEPHEPYERHPEYGFGDRLVDDYDSEVRAADEGIRGIVEAFRRARPKGVVVVSADHGEEFDDHGGRYHGTTVFEEQVRVPLVVAGPGVRSGARISTVVQTIDLFPTFVSALGIPRDPRILGRDLGPLLVGKVEDAGLAYAETDAAHLIARGTDRLICARSGGGASCALYDVGKDPEERTDLASSNATRRSELLALRRTLFDDLAKYEPKTKRPIALSAAESGDLEAAKDVVALLDDANVEIRRAAARIAFELARDAIGPADLSTALHRAETHGDDAEVLAFVRLSIARQHPELVPAELKLLSATFERGPPEQRLAAALVLAEHGDPRGTELLGEAWKSRALRSRFQREAIVLALAKAHTRSASQLLVAAFVAAAGHPEERALLLSGLTLARDRDTVPPLLTSFGEERYLDLREREALLLGELGAGLRLATPLRRFAGMPDARAGYLVAAETIGVLRPELGGASFLEASPREITLPISKRPRRLLVESDGTGGEILLDGRSLLLETKSFETIAVGVVSERRLRVPRSVRRIWLVDEEPELPPPPKEPWDAGPEE